MLVESKNVIESPVISVLVTAYNHERYISKCLDSILSQKINVPFELIIAEDCGKDNTREICIQYQKKYPEKIRLLLQEQNRGIPGNYCDVLSQTRGRYIAQLAGDDFWCDENKLQMQLEALESHQECDLCYTNCYTCNDDDTISYEPLLKDANISFEYHLLNSGYIAPCSWFFRRQILEYIELQDWFTDESLAVALDILHHSKLYFINKPTYVYRVHPNSAAAQRDPSKMWKYLHGIFLMQVYYAEKYNMPIDFITKLKIQEYYNHCSAALEAGEENFIDEAIGFCKDNGIIMKWFVGSCREYIKYKKQYEQIRSSKAYRLGKALLKPFKWLNRI